MLHPSYKNTLIDILVREFIDKNTEATSTTVLNIRYVMGDFIYKSKEYGSAGGKKLVLVPGTDMAQKLDAALEKDKHIITLSKKLRTLLSHALISVYDSYVMHKVIPPMLFHYISHLSVPVFDPEKSWSDNKISAYIESKSEILTEIESIELIVSLAK